MEATKRFAVLDSWRGVAALIVVAYHLVFAGHLFALGLVRHGYLFVDFFFVLSGFVIAYAYSGRLTTPTAALGFMIRRFGRLWPLHAAMLMIFVLGEGANVFLYAHSGMAQAFKPSANDNTLYSFVTNVLLVQTMGLHPNNTWNGASWSISAEFYAYVVFCAVFVFTPRLATPAAAVISGLSALVVCSYSTHAPVMDVTYDLGFFRCLYGFFVGVLVHALYRGRSGERGIAAHAGFWEVAVVALAFAFVAWAGATPLSLAAPLVFAPAVYVFAFEAGPISRLLRTKPFAALGAWSYSIYLIHAFLNQALTRGVKFIDHASGAALLRPVELSGIAAQSAQIPGAAYWMDGLCLLVLLAVVAASRFSFVWIEEPARKAVNGWAARIAAPRPAPVAVAARAA